MFLPWPLPERPHKWIADRMLVNDAFEGGATKPCLQLLYAHNKTRKESVASYQHSVGEANLLVLPECCR